MKTKGRRFQHKRSCPVFFSRGICRVYEDANAVAISSLRDLPPCKVYPGPAAAADTDYSAHRTKGLSGLAGRDGIAAI